MSPGGAGAARRKQKKGIDSVDELRTKQLNMLPGAKLSTMSTLHGVDMWLHEARCATTPQPTQTR